MSRWIRDSDLSVCCRATIWVCHCCCCDIILASLETISKTFIYCVSSLLWSKLEQLLEPALLVKLAHDL